MPHYLEPDNSAHGNIEPDALGSGRENAGQSTTFSQPNESNGAAAPRPKKIRAPRATVRPERKPVGPGRRPERPVYRPRKYPSDSVRGILASSGLHPKKMLGQNFLEDDRYLSKIVDAARLAPEDLVVEVGPGLGTLTRYLARRANEVITVEVDRDLATYLQSVYPQITPATSDEKASPSIKPEAKQRGKRVVKKGENESEKSEKEAEQPIKKRQALVRVVNADILEVDPAQLVANRQYKVVANLPYYITSPILRRFLEEATKKPDVIVVLVQREVAERIVAKAGDLSLLAISVQFYGKPTLIDIVPASAFYPAPKVDSAILRIELFPEPAVDIEPERFFKVVSAGFSQPRKQLHNSLNQRIWLPKDEAPDILREAEIDPMRRAQTVTIEEWAKLCRVLIAKKLL